MRRPNCGGKTNGLLCNKHACEGDAEWNANSAVACAVKLAAPDGMATAVHTARYGLELNWRNHCPIERAGAAALSASSPWPPSSCSPCPSSSDSASYLRASGFVGMGRGLKPQWTVW